MLFAGHKKEHLPILFAYSKYVTNPYNLRGIMLNIGDKTLNNIQCFPTACLRQTWPDNYHRTIRFCERAVGSQERDSAGKNQGSLRGNSLAASGMRCKNSPGAKGGSGSDRR